MAVTQSDTTASDRGQGHIVEIGAVGVVLIAGVVVTIAVTGVTPGAVAVDVDEVNQSHVSTEAEVETALQASLSDGSLKRTVLLWDASSQQFTDPAGTPAAGDREGQFLYHPETAFGKRLEGIENANDVRINVNAIPNSPETAPNTSTPSTRGERVRVVQRGSPDETARTVTVDVVLYDRDYLMPPVNAHNTGKPAIQRQTENETTVTDTGTYPIPEGGAVDDEPVYNTVTIQLVIWDV